MMFRLLVQLRPKNFARGRIAALLCGLYLTLVLAAWLSTIYDAYFVYHPDASFAGLPLIVLTAPLSFIATPLLGMLGAMDPRGFVQESLFWPQFLILGLIQTYAGWLVLRGRRLGTGHDRERATQ